MKTSPSSVDLQIGRNLKLKRIESGRSLQDIGDILQVSFQQVQKYERGQNKIAGSSLFLLSDALGLKVEDFFDNVTKDDGCQLQEEPVDFEYLENVSDYEITNLVRNYSLIQDKEVRKKILDLTITLQSTQEAQGA